MAWDDKIVDWYTGKLGLLLLNDADVGMIGRITKFHKKFLKGALKLIQIVGAYLITYWIYDTEGFEVAVLVLLVGILLAAGRVAANTKPYED